MSTFSFAAHAQDGAHLAGQSCSTRGADCDAFHQHGGDNHASLAFCPTCRPQLLRFRRFRAPPSIVPLHGHDVHVLAFFLLEGCAYEGQGVATAPQPPTPTARWRIKCSSTPSLWWIGWSGSGRSHPRPKRSQSFPEAGALEVSPSSLF